jgi:hypothetical protein
VGLCLLWVLLFAAFPLEASEQHKYALSLFHFNIQYVAGGLIGLLPEPRNPLENWMRLWDLSAEEVEDRIVRESFEPVLDLYASHPTWGASIELQGYFIEVLAERHPDVLEKLRDLVFAGQIEMVSFHYSDQLFIAYSSLDLERSQELNREVFETYGIPLSGTVFCQEGQASPGMASFMESHGYNVLVWPTNLYKYQHGQQAYQPYYAFGAAHMVIGSGSVFYNEGEIQVIWPFLDDGETLATNDCDPYFPFCFVHDPAAVERYEKEIESYEAQGFAISTVGRYVEEVISLGIEPSDPGPLLEGTWQPDDTDGVFRWLGGPGLFFFRQERDNHVRSLAAAAHRDLVAAETLAQTLEREGRPISRTRDRLTAAWRLLALAQVSDATGINPFRGEVEYGIAHAAEALRIARDLIEEGKDALGYQSVLIDTRAGSVRSCTGPPADPESVESGPVSIRVDAPGRTFTQRWQRLSTSPLVVRLEIAFSQGSGDESRRIRVTFPGTSQEIRYCPALQEETPVSYSRADFVWDHFVLPLPNGMIGLEEGRFVIKDTAAVHVGAIIYPDRGDVDFADHTQQPNEPVTWVFYIVEGSLVEAVRTANSLNIWPALYR